MLSYLLLFLCNLYILHIDGQICDGINEYQECSLYSGCLCFYKAYPSNATVCVDGFSLSCDELVRCEGPVYYCRDTEHECIYHRLCQKYPVCYPVPSYNEQFCPPSGTTTTATTTTTQTLSIPNIPADARWKQNGVTVAEGNMHGDGATNQLYRPWGLSVDDDQTVIIAECYNHRIVQWRKGDTNGQVIAGSNSLGKRLDQLTGPTDVLIDKETDSLIIADRGNRRVLLWSRRNGTKEGEILIDNIDCFGLALGDQRYLYISDGFDGVRRYPLGDKNGALVAGGNGKGNGLNQLNDPRYLFVDRQQNVFVSDNWNHRVMKWNRDAKQGIVVAGGNGYGNALTQLHAPVGIFVDTLGSLYVSDWGNHRVMRWSEGDRQGTVIVGGNGQGAAANQLHWPIGLSFDRHGNLYVADEINNRVQRFDIFN